MTDDPRITPELRREVAALTHEYMDRVDDAGLTWHEFWGAFRRERRGWGRAEGEAIRRSRKTDAGPRDAYERAFQVCLRRKG